VPEFGWRRDGCRRSDDRPARKDHGGARTPRARPPGTDNRSATGRSASRCPSMSSGRRSERGESMGLARRSAVRVQGRREVRSTRAGGELRAGTAGHRELFHLSDAATAVLRSDWWLKRPAGARETREDLANQLTGLLNEGDKAIRARFRESRRRGTARRGRGRRDGLGGAVVAALRRFIGSAGRLAASGPGVRAESLPQARAPHSPSRDANGLP
jgi:hypothetical protein